MPEGTPPDIAGSANPTPEGLQIPRVSTKRKIYWACLGVYVLSALVRVSLDGYWRLVSPRVIDAATGHTYALHGRGGTVFVKPFDGYVLNALSVFSWSILLVGLLIWAFSWRDWK